MTGERPIGNEAQEEALRIFQELGDEAGVAIVLHRLSVAAIAQQLTSVTERALPKMELLRDQFGEERNRLVEGAGAHVEPAEDE